MIEFYKIGRQWYRNYDKNSGLFEANILENELLNIKSNDNTLIILNGKFYNDKEKNYLFSLMQNFKIRIFIATDIVALDNNRDIIDNCQYLLHQCPSNDMIANSAIKQFYSWVPEVFYAYSSINTSYNKENKLIFGGGVRDNEYKITEYLKAVPSVAYLKTNTEDTRLEYFDYLRELSKYKYTIVIARNSYNKLGWVTARYCEAIANNVIPICDDTYDKNNHFAVLRVSSPEELRKLITKLNSSNEKCNSILKKEHQKLALRQNNFRNLIIDIIGGKYADNCRNC